MSHPKPPSTDIDRTPVTRSNGGITDLSQSTLLDLFASRALVGLMMSKPLTSASELAQMAYDVAVAMLRESSVRKRALSNPYVGDEVK